MLVTVRIDNLTFGGDGIGTILPEGIRCFVPFTMPGELVRVKVVEEKKRYLRGEVVEILEASRQRIAPPCPLFGSCGGCSWQHIPYEMQVEAKANILRETLRRIGSFQSPTIDCIPSPRPYSYRRRARFQIDRQGRLCFFATDGTSLIPLDSCPVLHPSLNSLLHEHSKNSGKPKKNQKELLIQVDGTGNVSSFSDPKAAPFLQANGEVNRLMRERVLSLVQEYSGKGDSRDPLLLDLYCGDGNLSLPLLRAGYRVLGFDTSRRAVEKANEEAGRPEQDAPYRVGDALRSAAASLSRQSRSQKASRSGGRGDALFCIIDPPRRGLGETGVQAVSALSPDRIFYISCNPASLARDINCFSRRGYEAGSVTLFDMFPQTSHLESLAVLKKKDQQGVLP